MRNTLSPIFKFRTFLIRNLNRTFLLKTFLFRTYLLGLFLLGIFSLGVFSQGRFCQNFSRQDFSLGAKNGARLKNLYDVSPKKLLGDKKMFFLSTKILSQFWNQAAAIDFKTGSETCFVAGR